MYDSVFHGRTRAVIVCVCVVCVVASEVQPLDGHASLLRDLLREYRPLVPSLCSMSVGSGLGSNNG